MFKNQMIQTIVDLQKKGVHIHLTDEGYRVFIRLMEEEFAFYNIPAVEDAV